VTGLPGSTVVLWDIDGTLLSTGRSGLRAWEEAVHEVLGRDADLAPMRMSGMTDRMIAHGILEHLGEPPDVANAGRLTEVYTRELPSCLTPDRGGVLPGVAAVLDALSARGDTVIALLTGNMRASACAKLACYGLDRYFSTGGFGDDGFDRVEIGRVALRRVAEAAGELDPGRVHLVGDSPYDVACARALGIHMIAVASGDHAVDDLGVGQPWWLLERLPAAEEFSRRVYRS